MVGIAYVLPLFPQMGETVEFNGTSVGDCVWYSNSCRVVWYGWNDATGAWDVLKEVGGLGNPINGQLFKPTKPGKYRVGWHVECTLVGGSDMSPVNFTVIKGFPLVELKIDPLPTGSLWWTVGDKVKVHGEIFKYDRELKKVYIDELVTVVLSIAGKAPMTKDVTGGKFEFEITLDTFGAYLITATTLENDNYNATLLPSLPVGAFANCGYGGIYNPLSKRCEVNPFVELTVPALPSGKLSFQIGDKVSVAGQVYYFDGLTKKPVWFSSVVDVYLNGVFKTTYTAAKGHFTVDVTLDKFGLYLLSAQTKEQLLANIAFNASLPSLPALLFANCEPGRIYNPFATNPDGTKGACEQPIILLMDSVTVDAVKEGKNKTISGKLYDILLNPIAGKKVTLEITDRGKYTVNPPPITTDAAGKFSTTILIPEITGILPFALVYITPTVEGTAQAFVPTPFTVYANKSLAALLVDLVLPATPKSNVAIKGMLKEVPSGAPVTGAPISLYDKDGKFVSRTKTDVDGTWTFLHVPVGDVTGLQTFAWVSFDGLAATDKTPRYDATGIYPVAAFIFQPTVFINPNLYSPIFVSTGWADSGVGSIEISGVLKTLGILENGGVGFKNAGKDEPMLLTFKGATIPEATVLTGSDGTFRHKFSTPTTTSILTLITVTMSYTGSTYLMPIVPTYATVLIYKNPFSGGGAGGGGGIGGAVAGIPVIDILAAFGIAVGAVVVVAGVDAARRKK